MTLKRQDQDSGISFGYNSQKERDLAYAQKVLGVLRGSDETAQKMGKNKIPAPQPFSTVQVNLHRAAIALAGEGNIITRPLKNGHFDASLVAFVSDGPDTQPTFTTPSTLWALDGNFSSLDEIVTAIYNCCPSDKTINLTQHAATSEQTESGVVEPAEKSAVQAALTFDAIPTASEMADRAVFLARIAANSGCKKAMIGGAPFFMAPLERALLAVGITPVYAFSVRDSREEPDSNGGVRKVNVFRHVGFVEAAQ